MLVVNGDFDSMMGLSLYKYVHFLCAVFVLFFSKFFLSYKQKCLIIWKFKTLKVIHVSSR